MSIIPKKCASSVTNSTFNLKIACITDFIAVQVYFLCKQAPPQNGEEAWEFSKKLVGLGMSIQKYIDYYNMENDER